MSAIMLAVDGVNKIYQTHASRVVAVEGATAAFASGTVTAIMGPSGSGKTTLLSILGLILKPSTGRVTLMGQDVTELDESRLPFLRRQHIGFIFQSFNLFSALTALENVLVALQLQKVVRPEAEAAALAALSRVGLEPRSRFFPRDLSGGEKQRVSIARALATNAPIILADEPTANLDSHTGLAIIDLLASLAREQGRTVVVVTHDPRLREHVDCTLRMEDGHVYEN
jgi:putative ABC transport system ATP-binding protein